MRARRSGWVRALLGAGGIALAGLVGCAARGAPPGAPVAPIRPWVEARSPHFTLATDLDADDAERALRGLEEMFTALREIAFPGAADPKAPIPVVVFRDREEFKAFAPRGASAYVVRRLPFAEARMPAMVFWDELDAGARRVVAHEIAHVLTGLALTSVPTWLAEGLATYYETLEIVGGAAYVGRTGFHSNGWVEERIPSFRDLRAMTRDEFYAKAAGGEVTRDEDHTLTGHYLAAWGAVHLLQTGPEELRSRFRRYLEALERGRHESAWQEAFDGYPPEELERAYRAHFARESGTVWRTGYTLMRARARFPVRPLSPSEVLLMEGRLAPAGTRRRFFEEAARLTPSSAECHYVLALTAEGVAETRRELELAHRLAPDDPQVLLHLARLAEEDRQQRAPGSPPTAEERALWDALVRTARTPTQLNSLAWRKAHDGRVAAAVALAKKAITLDPLCYECMDTYALALSLRGDILGALAAQRRAVELLPEGVVDREVQERLKEYEEKARAAGKATP